MVNCTLAERPATRGVATSWTPADAGHTRALILIGRTEGGRVLTLVIDRTVDPPGRD